VVLRRNKNKLEGVLLFWGGDAHAAVLLVGGDVSMFSSGPRALVNGRPHG